MVDQIKSSCLIVMICRPCSRTAGASDDSFSCRSKAWHCTMDVPKALFCVACVHGLGEVAGLCRTIHPGDDVYIYIYMSIMIYLSYPFWSVLHVLVMNYSLDTVERPLHLLRCTVGYKILKCPGSSGAIVSLAL